MLGWHTGTASWGGILGWHARVGMSGDTAGRHAGVADWGGMLVGNSNPNNADTHAPSSALLNHVPLQTNHQLHLDALSSSP